MVMYLGGGSKSDIAYCDIGRRPQMGSKRFVDREIWGKRWFRRLSPEQKLAWKYLCDNCDAAGVIALDEELAEFQIGESVD